MSKSPKTTFVVFSILSVLLTTVTSCTTLDVVPESPDASVLYAMRTNAAFGSSHEVDFFLNDVNITRLESNSYVALHLKPGNYRVKWETYDENGQQYTIEYPGVVEPAEVHETVINFAFGEWRSFEKITPGVGGNMLTGDPKYAGELDIREKVSPE